MIILTLTGEPKSTNNIYRYACRGTFPSLYMTHEGKERKQQYSLEARAQWGTTPPMEGRVAVLIIFYFGTKRKVDLDNFNKIVLDSLTGIAWVDDSQIDLLMLKRNADKANPHIEVGISPL